MVTTCRAWPACIFVCVAARACAALQHSRTDNDDDVIPDSELKKHLPALQELFANSTAEDWRHEPNATMPPGMQRHPRMNMVSHQQNCEAAPPVHGKPLPTLIFVMGLEGAGHNAVCPLIHNILASTGQGVDSLMKSSARQQFSYSTIVPFVEWKNEFLHNMTQWCPSGVCLDCGDSFRFRGVEHGLVSSPDFVRLVRLHQANLVDLRVVALTRNPTDAILATMRKWGHDTAMSFYLAQNYIMEMVLGVHKWSRLHCERLATLEYDAFIKSAETYSGKLLKLFGLQANPAAHEVFKTYRHDSRLFSPAASLKGLDEHLYEKMTRWLAEREATYWPQREALWAN